MELHDNCDSVANGLVDDDNYDDGVVVVVCGGCCGNRAGGITSM